MTVLKQTNILGFSGAACIAFASAVLLLHSSNRVIGAVLNVIGPLQWAIVARNDSAGCWSGYILRCVRARAGVSNARHT
jgi:hypothetical protein